VIPRLSAIASATAVLLFGSSPARRAPYDPQLATVISQFLSAKNPLLAANASVFVSDGLTYNVDPRLVVAIAGQESSYGTNWGLCSPSGYNAWSILSSGACKNYNSYPDAIDAENQLLHKYIALNLWADIPTIGYHYCGTTPDCAEWSDNVSFIYHNLLGGNLSDLTFARGMVDFEQLSGPSVFSGITPPVTVGIATFSGGQVLDATTALPVDRSKVYGTAFFCPGCLPTITISFSHPVSNFSVFLMNGLGLTITYVVRDNFAGFKIVTLPANFLSGSGTVSLPEQGILLVLISGDSSTTWDFLIDDVQFAPM
jgi:hypothetical protein